MINIIGRGDEKTTFSSGRFSRTESTHFYMKRRRERERGKARYRKKSQQRKKLEAYKKQWQKNSKSWLRDNYRIDRSTKSTGPQTRGERETLVMTN